MSPSSELSTVTQWVENPAGGRDRGPVALARAWVEVLVRPRQFFRVAVAPGDQAPGLVFAATVVLVAASTHLLTVPDAAPVYAGRPLASAVLVVLLLAVFVAPAALHLVAAVQTLILLPFVDDRAGVSETVQAIGYATAPCAFAGLSMPALTLACCGYGTVLLVVGVAEVHDVSVLRTGPLVAVPAALVFGYGFGGFAAAGTLARSLATAPAVAGV